MTLVGLPSLIDQLLISSAKRMKSASQLGADRICRDIMALQQNLKNLGHDSRPLYVDLDRSRKYFDLLRRNDPQVLLVFLSRDLTEISFVSYSPFCNVLDRSHVHSPLTKFESYSL